jgi:hypothetical protein
MRMTSRLVNFYLYTLEGLREPPLKAALKSMRGTKKYLWEKIRIMFFEYLIDTWEQLYTVIIGGIKPVRLSDVINNSS